MPKEKKTIDEAYRDDHHRKRLYDEAVHALNAVLRDEDARGVNETLYVRGARDSLRKRADQIVETWN